MCHKTQRTVSYRAATEDGAAQNIYSSSQLDQIQISNILELQKKRYSFSNIIYSPPNIRIYLCNIVFKEEEPRTYELELMGLCFNIMVKLQLQNQVKLIVGLFLRAFLQK